jgi:transposase
MIHTCTVCNEDTINPASMLAKIKRKPSQAQTDQRKAAAQASAAKRKNRGADETHTT